MNQKEKLELAENINKTFSVFEFLLKDEEKPAFKALVAKSKSSSKAHDRLELYQAIQKLLLHTNFLHRNELYELCDKLFELEDDFNTCATRSQNKIEGSLAHYTDQETDQMSAVVKSQILSKEFSATISDLQNRKQEYENACATLQKLQMVYDKLNSKEWQKNYCRWVNGESVALRDAADNLDAHFDTLLDDEYFWDHIFLTLVGSIAGIPLAALGVAMGAAQYVIEAPFVLASKLSPSNRKDREALPTATALLTQIKKTLPPQEVIKTRRFPSDVKMGRIYPMQNGYYQARDHLGVSYVEVSAAQFHHEVHTKALQRMDDKINAFEQLRTDTMNQFTSAAANQINGKKSKLNLSTHPSHLIEEQKTVNPQIDNDCDILTR